MRTRSKKLHLTRKTLIIGVILALVLAGGGVFAYQQTRSASKKPPTKTSDESQPLTQSGDDELNLNPPSEEEKNETEQHKDDLAKPTQPTQPGNTKQVSVTIVDASQYNQEVEVRAFVSGVFEDGGTCRIVFTQGSYTVAKQTNGFKNATTTTCTPLTVPRSEFPAAGEWQVTVGYSSQTASGSAKQTVRLQ